MKIKKANLKKFASFSALGAGALGAAAGSAEASSIVFSGPVNKQIGFCSHCLSGFSFAGPGGALVGIGRYGFCSSSYCFKSVNAFRGGAGNHGTIVDFAGVRNGGFIVSALPKGAQWGTHRTTAGSGVVGFSEDTIGGGPVGGSTPFKAKDRYFLFRFTGGELSQDIYGWAQLDVKVSKSERLDVKLVDYAYDTSGAQLPAGDTGQTPEPSTFVLTGFAALALGAKGLRAWRAARKAPQI